MTFDVNTLVEDVFSKFIYPDILKVYNPYYFPLESYNFNLLKKRQNEELNSRYNEEINKYRDTVSLIWFSPYLGLTFRPTKITVSSSVTNPDSQSRSVTSYDLLLIQDWKKFLEQDLPEFVKRKF